MSVSTFNMSSISTFTNSNIVTDSTKIHENVRLSKISKDLTNFRENGYKDFTAETFQDATLNNVPIVAILVKNMYDIGYLVIVVTRSE